MNTLNTFRSLNERTMTTKEKTKEDRLKDKYDDSSMKDNMKDHYGKEEGEKVYYATIRKQAMKNEHHQKDADGNEIPHEAPGTPASVEEAAQPAGQVPDKRAEALKKRQSMIKKQVLMKKLQSLRQGGGEDIIAHNELEGEMVEGIGDAVKKGVKRHKDAVEKKKIKNRKAVPYAALAAEHEPEGEMVEDYYSGTGEKVQARTLAWMRKKGQKGSPGLNAMKAREAEHKAKRGVKGVKEGYRVLASADGQEKPSQFAYKDEKTAKKYADSIKKGGGKATVTKEGTYDEPDLEKRKKNNEKARKELKKDAKDSGYTDIALKASMSKGAGVSEAKVDQGRSDYGKATIRNWRHSGPDTVEPAMFDSENKRGKTIDKRREEHKARRGKKGAKVPTYKKESFSDWRTDLGEEGYDRMRDARLVKYGIGHDGSDRKGSTSRPTGKQPKGKTVLQKETEKKYGKGVSALDVVKAKIRAKHGKDAIMEPKK